MKGIQSFRHARQRLIKLLDSTRLHTIITITTHQSLSASHPPPPHQLQPLR